MKDRKLGIIGGMGPLATCRFMERIINHTKANRDQDHIDMLISNHATIPDRTNAILGHEDNKFLDEIKKDFDAMNILDVDYIAIPCNTSHFYMNDFKLFSKKPIIDMIEETMNCVKNSGYHKIVVFGTDGTLHSKVYNIYANKHDIEVVKHTKEEQKVCMDTIYQVKERNDLSSDIFQKLLSKYSMEGVLPILACTELSCLKLDPEIYYLDAMDCLTKACIDKIGKIYI